MNMIVHIYRGPAAKFLCGFSRTASVPNLGIPIDSWLKAGCEFTGAHTGGWCEICPGCSNKVSPLDTLASIDL